MQDPECVLTVEQVDREEVTDLQDEATQFLVENRLPLTDLAIEENDLLSGREGGPQLSQRPERVLWKFEQNAAHSALVAESLEQDDVVNGKREELVGFARQIRNAIADGGIDDRVSIEFVRDGLVVDPEDVLVDAEFLVEEFQCRFEPLCKSVNGISVEAFEVHATHFNDRTDIPPLRDEKALVNQAP